MAKRTIKTQMDTATAKHIAQQLSLARSRVRTLYDETMCDYVIDAASKGKMYLLATAEHYCVSLERLKFWRKERADFGEACAVADAIYCSQRMGQYEQDMRKNKGSSAMWQHYAKTHIDRILYPEDNNAQNLVVNINKPSNED